MMPMTSTIPAGEDPVSIHVYDPALGLEHVFQCSKELLDSQVGYFANQTTYDRLTIENCDLCLFDWLIRWLHGEVPTFATTNVLRILLLATFLSIERLVQQCIDFCIEEKVDMSCVAEGDLLRLAPHATACHLEGLAGAGSVGAGTGRLFYELLAAWTGGLGAQPLRGNFCNLARVYRCRVCSSLVHTDRQRTGDACPRSPHPPDPAWSLLGHVARLHKETRSWRSVYWRLWGQVHHFLCSRCRVYFPAERMSWGERTGRDGPLGATYFACCHRRVHERDFLHNVEGCVSSSCSSDDVCQALYQTMGMYLSMVTRDPDQVNVAGALECKPCEPIVDMSMIWRGERRMSLVLEPLASFADQLYEDSDDDRASCKDPSDEEDACLRTESVERWVYDDTDKDPRQTTIDEYKHQNSIDSEDATPNIGLLGPHGDYLDFSGKPPIWSKEDVCVRSEYQPRSNKDLSPIITKDQRHSPDESEPNGDEGMTKITQDGKCSSEDSASDDSQWIPKVTQDSKRSTSTENSGNYGSERMPKITLDDKASAAYSASDDSDWTPKTTYNESADDNPSDGSERMPKITQDDKSSVDDSESDGSEWSPTMTREYACGAEGDASPARSDCSEDYASNTGRDESTASSKSREETERVAEQGTGEESTADGKGSSETAYVAARVGNRARRKHEHCRHWQSHLSNACNQINQHNYELYENKQIIHYLTSKIYKLRKARCKPDALSGDDKAARSKWWTHIEPRDGMYMQIEHDFIRPRTLVNTSPSDTQCEETDLCTNILYEPTWDSTILVNLLQ